MMIAILTLALGWGPAGAEGDGVDALIRAAMERRHVPGLAVAVVRDGKVVLSRGYGLASVELAVPATPATVFELASVSKQFTASAVMLLVEDGKLGLGDKVVDRLPGLPAAWKEVRIRHLLEHTSGIADYLGSPGLSLRDDHDAPALIGLVAPRPLGFEPGSAWEYSNTNYLLLGLIVERASGQQLGQFLEARIFRPAGMLATRANDPFAIIPNRATGYDREGGKLRVREFISPSLSATGDGAVGSTVLDLARWVIALEAGTILKPDLVRRMWTPARLRDGKAAGYGFGWLIGQDGRHRLIEHAGAFPGFNSDLAIYPDDRLATVVLANTSTAHAERIGRAVAAQYLPDLVIKPEPALDVEDPATTAAHKAVLVAWLAGKLDPARFTPEARAALFPAAIEDVRKQLAPLGALGAFAWLDAEEGLGLRTLRYRARIGTESLILTVSIDGAARIAGIAIQPE